MLGFGCGSTGAMPSDEAPFSHQDWEAVLQRFVDDQGLVDYSGLARDRAVLDRYVLRVRKVSPESHPALFPTREEQLAYYINAYNALTFEGVLERGPEEKSVWLGGLVSGYQFFVKHEIRVGGRTMNLKKLEDDVVRAQFQDPRIHAALNCASIGCPRLPREAFRAATLDAQLDAAMREFVNDPRRVSLDASGRKLTLSKIFDWFSKDFLEYERAQGRPRASVVDFINRFRPEDAQLPTSAKLRFPPYDKRINKQPESGAAPTRQ